MSSTRSRSVALASAAVVSLAALSACGTSSDGAGSAPGGKVTLSVNGQPPTTQAFERRLFDRHVEQFEKAHPDIDIVPHEGFMDPKTFNAKLAGGQLEDVFYVYFTDTRGLIGRNQAADITDHLKGMPHRGDVQDALMKVFQDAKGRQYGLPTANYSMGLLYNRTLFKKAGLDPDKPPRTWAEVRAAAKRIAVLGDSTVGYADYSKNNQGGWHFTAELYSRGGRIATERDGKWKAAFNSAAGKATLRDLHAMRWQDGSMGSKQLLQAEDVQRMMGSGKLGMYVSAADNITVIAKQFGGAYRDYGLAPVPDARSTLIGGEGYMFNPKASPEKIRAGIKWLQWKYLNPDLVEQNIRDNIDSKLPVGLPMPPTPDIWKGAVRERVEQAKRKYANVPVANYQPFMDAAPRVPGVVEPPEAQQVYAVLDTVMQAVLTRKDADIDTLLTAAEKKVDQIYSAL
ncbi:MULTISPECIES: ABC transporter substrate-binding protein [Streptomyces]|uniref:Extracellular solute-binding protein n=2 Tax=Streptomyces rimosus subsp. rimosus TaxID=132474 RepID=L8F0R5_STRR1|nr:MULTISPECIES: extracellular solute-binding protein [Streptomyces]KOG77746.1 sugar ABC transporter substrate-binding protein [Kitasatospora aureofaciens]MYT47984.1 extracellular solute-binding protein [Streptomyces sp. SID5471]KEF06770.1 sugar ABC transporter substrate-binding protein [Streptomyces rimosus]KOT40050.1 sugar ABC transporter substrate-binding protein [Streptomyces rimosus subsp. rimosus]KOT42956.1 sugar ABC transporter substrate-binding protein [Streptomyces sp. NRRL WC-3701]